MPMIACPTCGRIHAQGECRPAGSKIQPKQPSGWHRRQTSRGKEITQATRKAVKQRFRHTCQRCGLQTKQGEIHHIVPKSRGGPNEISNLQYLCRGCHRKIPTRR